MDDRYKKIIPHTQLLEALFAFKSHVSTVFKDVLGIHNIHHLAITRVDALQQLLIFSSTPAMEYNLFSGDLWVFDDNYNPEKIGLNQLASWSTLYQSERYDELYYQRQTQHNFSSGFSLAIKTNDEHYICSYASTQFEHSENELTQHFYDDFYKIGQYCKNLLMPVFSLIDEPVSAKG